MSPERPQVWRAAAKQARFPTSRGRMGKGGGMAGRRAGARRFGAAISKSPRWVRPAGGKSARPSAARNGATQKSPLPARPLGSFTSQVRLPDKPGRIANQAGCSTGKAGCLPRQTTMFARKATRIAHQAARIAHQAARIARQATRIARQAAMIARQAARVARKASCLTGKAGCFSRQAGCFSLRLARFPGRLRDAGMVFHVDFAPSP